MYLGGEGQGIGINSANPDLAWHYLEQTYLDSEGQLMALEPAGSLPAVFSADSAIIFESTLASGRLRGPVSVGIIPAAYRDMFKGQRKSPGFALTCSESHT